MESGMDWARFGLLNFVVASIVSYYIGRWHEKEDARSRRNEEK